MALKTFRSFIESPESRAVVDAEFTDRYQSAGPGVLIDTVTKLKAFCKERWPDQNPSDYRRSPAGVHSREDCARIWAAYLEWRERPEQPAPVEKKTAPKAVGA